MITENMIKALEYSWKVVPQDQTPQKVPNVLYYLLRLFELEPKAVTISKRDTDRLTTFSTFLSALYPDDCDCVSIEEVRAQAEKEEPYMLTLEIRWSETYDLAGAAKVAQVDKRTIERWISKKLPSFTYGGKRYVWHHDLVKYMRLVGHVPGHKRRGTWGLE